MDEFEEFQKANAPQVHITMNRNPNRNYHWNHDNHQTSQTNHPYHPPIRSNPQTPQMFHGLSQLNGNGNEN